MKLFWEWRPAGQEKWNKRWQQIPRNVEKFQGVDTATLTITNVQKSDEGEYRCTVSNYACSETSRSAILTVGKICSTYTQIMITTMLHNVPVH